MHAIVTHTDLDGVISASVYILGRGIRRGGYRVVFIEPIEVSEKLCNIINGGYRAVAVMDIGVNAETLNSLLKCLATSTIKIYWYDHHLWDAAWIDAVGGFGVELQVDSSSKCAAEVVANSLNVADPLIRGYVDIACAVDSWSFYRWEAPYLYRYVDYAKRVYGLERVFADVLDAIERGVEASEFILWIDPFVERYMDEELKTVSGICRDVRRIRVDGIDVCIYYKGYSIPNQSVVGNAILNICGCSIAAVVRHDLTSISFRSRDYNVREIAKRLGGGGHTRAAGAPLKMGRVFRVALNILPLDSLRRSLLYSYLEDRIREAVAEVGAIKQ